MRTEKLCAEIDKAISKLPKKSVSLLRCQVVHVIKNPPKVKSNLGFCEWTALRQLKSNCNIIITKAEKGNCCVVI